MKEQEKKKQLKPFYAGSTNMAQGNKPGLTITAVPSRPITRLQVKNATNKLNAAAQKQPKQTKPTTQVQGNSAPNLSNCLNVCVYDFHRKESN